MNRFFAFMLAIIFATAAVSSACVAAPSDWVRFTLEGSRKGNEIQARFHEDRAGNHHSNWSTGLMPSHLIGLDVAGFYTAGTRPLRFAVVRDAGRLDCSGSGDNARASGSCGFTPDANFSELVAGRGIARPTRDQSFVMMAVNVRRELVMALAASRYPRPTIDNLIELTAVGVTGGYIQGLGHAGYRPASLHDLVEFKALGITPEYIGGLIRIGYGGLPPHQLVQLKALNITPEFIAGFERAGYRNLPVGTLVELKALAITPEEVRAAERVRGVVPSTAELMRRRR